MKNNLKSAKMLHVQQVLEGFEIVLGWESRNKYRILDENNLPIGFAAEESSGIAGALMRQFFGHWRSFKVTIFNQQKQPEFFLEFPFRWFFKTLIIKDASGKRIGQLEQRFAFFRKKFDVFGKNNRKIAYINSSFFKLWTFDVFSIQRIGSIQKKWSGALSEFFTDKDNFVVIYDDQNLEEDTKAILLGTCLMVDIIYFENNQGKGSVVGLFD